MNGNSRLIAHDVAKDDTRETVDGSSLSAKSSVRGTTLGGCSGIGSLIATALWERYSALKDSVGYRRSRARPGSKSYKVGRKNTSMRKTLRSGKVCLASIYLTICLFIIVRSRSTTHSLTNFSARTNRASCLHTRLKREKKPDLAGRLPAGDKADYVINSFHQKLPSLAVPA